MESDPEDSGSSRNRNEDDADETRKGVAGTASRKPSAVGTSFDLPASYYIHNPLNTQAFTSTSSSPPASTTAFEVSFSVPDLSYFL